MCSILKFSVISLEKCSLSLVLNRNLSISSPSLIRTFKPPPVFENTTYPEKHRLPILPKVPSIWAMAPCKVYRGTREMYRMRGPENTHTKLILGQFGIVAVTGGALKNGHFEMMRNSIGRKLKANRSFSIYRVDPPYKAETRHGLGKKLGGGKGSISYYMTPIRAGRIIVEVAGHLEWEEVQPWLNDVAMKLPFEAIAVNEDLLNRLNTEEARLERLNTNPYTFEWIVRNNFFDCQRKLSPWDQKWFGKFVYLDRSNKNKMWNEVRQSRYKHR